ATGCQTMPFLDLIPAAFTDTARLQDAWAEFREVVAQAETRLAGLADDEVLEIHAEDGEPIGMVDAQDLKRKFGNLTWSLATGGVTNGGVGEVASRFARPGDFDTWTSAQAAVQVDGLLGYAAWHGLGLHYLALHETAHITRLGLATWRACWDAYVGRDAPAAQYPASAEWRYNEQVANQIARVVGRRLDLDELPSPSEGFPGACNHLGLRVA
ncbi:MAG: hypothetical protein JWQ97_256, partial [Phenylobacterium sp.]|nr:hypothetical protein [Phenylobacterium sp.]